MLSEKNPESGSMQIRECRQLLSVYKIQKQCIQQISENEAGYYAADFERTKEIMEQNVRMVDQMLFNLERIYGQSAAEIVRTVYINKCKQAVTARVYGYSLRTLQRKCHLWIRTMAETAYEK